MKVYVDADFITYFQTFLGRNSSDPLYNPAFDINKDGLIDIVDLAYFTTQSEQWVELEAPANPLHIALAGAGGLAAGFLISKIR